MVRYWFIDDATLFHVSNNNNNNNNNNKDLWTVFLHGSYICYSTESLKTIKKQLFKYIMHLKTVETGNLKYHKYYE